MTRKSVNTILVDLNLEVNRVFGLRDGLAVELNGIHQDVHLETIEDNQKLL